MTPSSFVLYVNDEGTPSPLGHCYYATASRRLSSAGMILSTEVDSAYCPQCLQFFDVTTAATYNYHCPKCTCCPKCCSTNIEQTDGNSSFNMKIMPAHVVVSVQIHQDENDETKHLAYFQCGYCDWNTKDNPQLCITVQLDDETSPKSAQEELIKLWTQQRALHRDKQQAKYNSTLNEMQQQVKEHIKQLKKQQQQKSLGTTFYSASKNTPTQSLSTGPWNVQALEQSLLTKKKSISLEKDASLELSKLTATEDDEKDTESIHPLSILLQPATAQRTKFLLPLGMPLRPRMTKRCRAELSEGRPGILVKPKLNPLEGDSSLRSGHGQWWKKDSSALHSVPKVNIVRHHQDDNAMVLLMKITNTTLSVVRLRFQPSGYNGIRVQTEDDGTTARTTHCKNVVVDSLRGTLLTFDLNTRVSIPTIPQGDDASSDWIALEAVEDSLFGPAKIPSQVLEWQPNLGDDASPSSRMIAQRGDTAWLEMVVTRETTTKDNAATDGKSSLMAFAMSMQIAVGNGSWESSLIQAQSEDDHVTFDLVLVLKEDKAEEEDDEKETQEADEQDAAQEVEQQDADQGAEQDEGETKEEEKTE